MFTGVRDFDPWPYPRPRKRSASAQSTPRIWPLRKGASLQLPLWYATKGLPPFRSQKNGWFPMVGNSDPQPPRLPASSRKGMSWHDFHKPSPIWFPFFGNPQNRFLPITAHPQHPDWVESFSIPLALARAQPPLRPAAGRLPGVAPPRLRGLGRQRER